MIPTMALPRFSLIAAAWALSICAGLPARANPVVAIDAGHTRTAQGALSAVDGRAELFFNMDMAKRVGDSLAKIGIAARQGNLPPREKENFPQRASAGAGADFFLSIHHDSAQSKWLAETREPGRPIRFEDRDGRFKGFALFVDPGDAKGLACARLIGAALVAAGEAPSLYHSDPTYGESRPLLDSKHGVHAFPGLALARLRKAPMALLEVGVIVNPAESLRLRDKLVQRRIADAAAQGLSNCLSGSKPH